MTTNDQGRTARTRSLAVVVPVYNSEQSIGRLVDKLVEELDPQVETLEIVLVNDGSTDGSHQAIRECYARHPAIVKYIRLARNFGEHNAVMCGLRNVSAEAAVIVDDDFQNPPEEIMKLVTKLSMGFDVVYSEYAQKRHSHFRNLGSKFNNWMATRLLGKPHDLYLSSFKALNKFLIDTILRYDGPYPYIDGLILRSTNSIGTALCEHRARATGQSNYNLIRLLRLWLNMFTSFSLKPLRIATVLGIVMSGVGFLMAIYFLFSRITGIVFLHHEIPPGWASIIISIVIFSGVQLCILGVIGEYIGRIFLTQNREPQFVVREVTGARGKDSSTDV